MSDIYIRDKLNVGTEILVYIVSPFYPLLISCFLCWHLDFFLNIDLMCQNWSPWWPRLVPTPLIVCSVRFYSLFIFQAAIF